LVFLSLNFYGYATIRCMSEHSTPLQLHCERQYQRLQQVGVITDGQTDRAIIEKLNLLIIASDFAVDTLCRQPSLLAKLDHLNEPVPELPIDDEASWPVLIRQWRARESTRVIWRDIHGIDSVQDSLSAISGMADKALQTCVSTLSAQFASRYGVVRNTDGEQQGLIVFALGKLGGGELNFSSDVDLVYAFGERGESDGARSLDAETYFTRLGQRLAQLLSDITADGFAYRVDLRLRPYGQSGRLAISTAAMEHYFQTEGRDWERYAWVKARTVAGDFDAGQACLNLLRPFVYRRYLDYGALDGLREMKTLIAAEVEKRELADNLKLGPGGIREIEFLVQAFQLIHGGREPLLRQGALLNVLPLLAQLGFLSAASAEKLQAAYLFLRRLENRVQMLRDEQTHSLPNDSFLLHRIAIALQYQDVAALHNDVKMHRDAVSEEFSHLLESKRHKPKTDAFSQYWRALPDEANATQLAGLGFLDSDALHNALRDYAKHADTLNLNTRTRSRLDHVLPMILSAAAHSSAPESALKRSLGVLYAIAKRSSYLALLEEKPAALQRLVDIVASSAWLTERLVQHPLLLDELLDHRMAQPFPDASQLQSALSDILAIADVEQSLLKLNELRQSLSFRIAKATLFKEQSAVQSSLQLANLAQHVLQAIWQLARDEMQQAHGVLSGATFAVIGYGSVGAKELGFGSDLDVVFLYEASPHAMSDGSRTLDASRYFARWAQKMISLMQTLTPAGRLYEIDMRLRPDGAKGLLVSSIESFIDYQRERAWTWEHQALVRARALAGDASLCQQFETLRSEILQRPRDQQKTRSEIMAMRQRMRSELDRSSIIRFDLKQGLGGLVDMEFFLQSRVMCLASQYPELIIPRRSPDILMALINVGDLSAEQHLDLMQQYDHLMAQSMLCSLDQRPRIIDVSIETDVEKNVRENTLSIYDSKNMNFNQAVDGVLIDR
jgi:[glutamine synthetase] adenylyltransferase / [glutamine synthetase]-adenylyl-L-tyrosine phosphorylase